MIKSTAGYRCKGRLQHCYYPNSTDGSPTDCYDHSDKIVSVEEECYQEINKDREECKCTKIEDFEYFQCPINDTPHCIHPELVCDGHAACDNSEDEVLTLECIEKLARNFQVVV